jgi:ABC-type phosphate transport system substrate-binding protein
MANSQRPTALALTLLASLAIAPLSFSTMLVRMNWDVAIAQTTDDLITFPVPETVTSGTTVRLDGSSSMIVINGTLKENFEAEYPGTTVDLAAQGTDVALEALINGEIDLAAVGRPLTDEEKAQGLVEVPISREKIAIIVGPENPFSGNLTSDQFARMFRGEITDWSEVGGTPGPIRFVDRPDFSDTRLSLSRYQVFLAAPFETGENAVQVAEDDTTAVIEGLGSDGISYAIASQVLGQDNVKIVSMHQTLPDNPAYPYSQPRGYVYYQEPTPAAQAFLGFATAPAGQDAVDVARQAEAAAVAAGEAVTEAEVAPVQSLLPLSGVLSSGAIAISPDGNLIAGAGEGNTVRLWNIDGTPLQDPFVGHENTVRSVAISPDGQRIASAGDDGTIRLWDLQGNPIGEPFTGHEGSVRAIAFSPDGQSLVSGGNDSTIRRWNLDGMLIGQPFRGHSETIRAVGFSPDGQTIVSGGEDDYVRLWGLDGLLAGQATITHDGDINSVAFRPDGQSVASASDDGTIRLWDLQGNPIGEPFTGHDGAVNAIAFSPDSQMLVSGGTDGTVRQWNLDGSAIGTPITGHAAAINAVAFAPNGEAIASGGADGTIRLWGLDGQPIGTPLVGYGVPASARERAFPLWLLWLLPLLLLGLLIAWLLRRRATQPSPAAGTDAGVADAGAVPNPALVGTDGVAAQPNQATNEAIASDDEAAVLTGKIAVGDAAMGRTMAAETNGGRDEPVETQGDLGQMRGAGMAGGAAVAGVGMAATLGALSRDRTQSNVEATRFDVGQSDLSREALADVDQDLPELPEGYGESRIVLLPRDPQWGYTYWDIPNEHKQAVRQQGGTQLALRLYDVTDIDLDLQRPHSLQQYHCDELARDWYVPIPVSDRDYVIEIGYVSADANWLMMARSAPMRVPPVYPSDWFDDQFMTIVWDEDLRGKTFLTLIPPSQQLMNGSPLHTAMFDMSQSAEALRVTGSLFGSMQQVPEQAISSYVFPSGVGMWALPTMSMSGIGMSGVGFSASVPPIRPRKFWLVADAELIVYGATEPDATVLIGDRAITLNPDGTFRFQMSFQDGNISYPIQAIAADGEQTRWVRMEFDRETPHRHTNTKDEAQEEWPNP